jgi:hypothetical protein
MCIADPLEERLLSPQHSRAEIFVGNTNSRHVEIAQIPVATSSPEIRVRFASSVYICGSISCLSLLLLCCETAGSEYKTTETGNCASTASAPLTSTKSRRGITEASKTVDPCCAVRSILKRRSDGMLIGPATVRGERVARALSMVLVRSQYR